MDVRRLMRLKMNTDFDGSWLNGTVGIIHGLKQSELALEKAGLIGSAEDPRLGTSLVLLREWHALSDQDYQAFARTLKGLPPIRINSAALFPAVAACLIEMVACLKLHDVQIVLDYSDYNSHNQLLRVVAAKESLDFLIAAEAAYFTFSCTDHQRLLPCHGERQWAIVRRDSADEIDVVHVFNQSTAEMQFRTGFNIPGGAESPFEKSGMS